MRGSKTLNLLELVNKEPITCSPEDPLKRVVDLMAANDIGSVVVTKGGKVVGIFTERDLVKAMSSGASLDEPVSKYMTKDIIFANPNESVENALAKMLRYGIRHLPVVDEGKRLLGVVSIKDLVEALFESLALL